jgi:hypothetical protein
MEWSIGITTCKRKTSMINELVLQIVDNGWDKITIYADAGSDAEPCDSTRVVYRDIVYGCWTNWICGLMEMYCVDVNADVYIMFEDDIEMCMNLRPYLEHIIPSLDQLGVLSIYTPPHHAKKAKGLFCIHDESYRGGFMWGTQAVLFTKTSLASFLSSKNVADHLRTETGRENKNRDSAIGMWAKQSGHRVYYHTPSLVQHADKESTIGHEHHEALDFVGKDFDATALIPERLPVVASQAEISLL